MIHDSERGCWHVQCPDAKDCRYVPPRICHIAAAVLVTAVEFLRERYDSPQKTRGSLSNRLQDDQTPKLSCECFGMAQRPKLSRSLLAERSTWLAHGPFSDKSQQRHSMLLARPSDSSTLATLRATLGEQRAIEVARSQATAQRCAAL